MTSYLEELKALEMACHANFETDCDEQNVDEEYIRIRVVALNLLDKACRELAPHDLPSFRNQIIEFLCANMGCHLDIEILESESASVLSQSEIEFIIDNSALSRWY